MLTRRDFLATAAAPLAGAAAGPHTILDRYWLPILDGFLRNAARTSPSFAVCDFPDGTILKSSIGRSGKTYDSVTRMMPALAAWVASGRAQPELLETLRSMYRNAFDPQHPDYWLPAEAGRSNQRQVESSVVAWSVWVLRDKLLPLLTTRERANIQAWLASCTQQPVRRNNWAWFTAVNQAVRLDLAARWPEFSGDKMWMIEDLKALDGLAAGDGWYSDSPGEPIYDYYNFWVFASHFLYWNKIAGREYPEWKAKFTSRLRQFLDKTPYFFGANGSHILYGRSLIYRWGVLTPLVLAYEQGLWPHSPGLLRSIVRRNLDFHWRIGAFDEIRGKLRETYSTTGTRAICDSYVDNGHPYWGMQAYAFYLLPERDPFWTAHEEPLPVEAGDFRVRFDALKMMLVGTKASGEVRWLQALTYRDGPEYRDKYTKFSYSSHFAFNLLKEKDRIAGDAALYFRDPRTGVVAARAGIRHGELIGNGVEIEWWTILEKQRIEVISRVEVHGGVEKRTHTVTTPVEVEVFEGSYPLGLDEGEQAAEKSGKESLASQARRGRIETRMLAGYRSMEAVEAPGNALAARSVVHMLRGGLGPGRTVLSAEFRAIPAV